MSKVNIDETPEQKELRLKEKAREYQREKRNKKTTSQELKQIKNDRKIIAINSKEDTTQVIRLIRESQDTRGLSLKKNY